MEASSEVVNQDSRRNYGKHYLRRMEPFGVVARERAIYVRKFLPHGEP